MQEQQLVMQHPLPLQTHSKFTLISQDIQRMLHQVRQPPWIRFTWWTSTELLYQLFYKVLVAMSMHLLRRINQFHVQGRQVSASSYWIPRRIQSSLSTSRPDWWHAPLCSWPRLLAWHLLPQSFTDWISMVATSCRIVNSWCTSSTWQIAPPLLIGELSHSPKVFTTIPEPYHPEFSRSAGTTISRRML